MAFIRSSLLAMMAALFHQIEQHIRTKLAFLVRASAYTSNTSNGKDRRGHGEGREGKHGKVSLIIVYVWKLTRQRNNKKPFEIGRITLRLRRRHERQ